MLISALIALGVAVLGSAVLARRLSRPLAAIEEAARAIGAGDLTARVGTIAHADAEIARLARRSTAWPPSSTGLGAASGPSS